MQIMAQCNKKKKKRQAYGYEVLLLTVNAQAIKEKKSAAFDRLPISLSAKYSWTADKSWYFKLNTAAIIQACRCIGTLSTSTCPSTAYGYSVTNPVAPPCAQSARLAFQMQPSQRLLQSSSTKCKSDFSTMQIQLKW